MEGYYPFTCDRCGECCKHIDRIAELKNLDRGDGICIHLTNENLCEIYPDRPLLCNGEKVHEKFFPAMSVAEFHAMTWEFCKLIKEGNFEKLFEDESKSG